MLLHSIYFERLVKTKGGKKMRRFGVNFSIDLNLHTNWYRCKRCLFAFSDGGRRCPLCGSSNVVRVKGGFKL